MTAIAANDETAIERHVTSLKPIAEEHNLHIWLSWARLGAHFLKLKQGDPSGFDEAFEVDSAMIASKNRIFAPIFRTEAGRCALALGLRDEATQLATSAQELMDQTGEIMWMSELTRLQAALAKTDGDNKTAEEHLRAALDVAQKQGAKLLQLRAAIDLARLWQERGRTDEANALLVSVSDSIAEGECPEDQATARELLAELTA